MQRCERDAFELPRTHLQHLNLAVAVANLLLELSKLCGLLGKLAAQLPIASALRVELVPHPGEGYLRLRALRQQRLAHRCLAPPELLFWHSPPSFASASAEAHICATMSIVYWKLPSGPFR